MTDVMQTLDWFGEGFFGLIPVWDSTGNQVGTRTSYDANAPITFNSLYKGDTTLFSKNIVGADIVITIPASSASAGLSTQTPIDTNAVVSATTAANYPAGSLASQIAGTADTVTTDIGSLSAGINDALNLPALTLFPASSTTTTTSYLPALLIGGGALVLLLILLKK